MTRISNVLNVPAIWVWQSVLRRNDKGSA